MYTLEILDLFADLLTSSLIPAIFEGICIAYHIIIKMQFLQRTASFVSGSNP